MKGEGMKTLGSKMVATSLAVALSGCALASVGTEPAPDLYVLTAPSPVMSEAAPATDLQLLVEKPFAPAAIDTNRIAIRPTPNEIRYYAGARWTDRAPQMVQQLIVEALENTGKFLAVGRRSAGLRSDYALTGDLRSFGAEPSNGLSAAPVVRVEFNARLIRRQNNLIMASKVFSAEVPAASGDVGSVVKAFDAAVHEVLGDLSVWTLEQVQHPRRSAVRR